MFAGDDDIVVTRVYRSTSAVFLQEKSVIMPGFPYLPKASKSDVFSGMDERVREKSGNKAANRKSMKVINDAAATFDIGGDVGDVSFNDSEGIEVITLF